MATKTKTGQKAPVSGQYKPVGSKTEVTLVKGKTVPPTPKGATTFVLVDKTKHGKRGILLQSQYYDLINLDRIYQV